MLKIDKRRLLIIVVLLAVLGWLGSSGVATWKLTRRPLPPFAEPPPEVDWGRLEPHRLTTSDGQQIGAWLARGDSSRGCVLMAHGIGACRAEFLPLIEFLAGEGFTTMTISLRAHGDSSGAANDFGYGARHDLIAAVEFLEAEFPDRRIFVVGRSMGAAAALFAAEELGDRVAGYLLESPYKGLKTAAGRRLQGLPPLLNRIAYAGLQVWSRAFLPVSAEQIAPAKHAEFIPQHVPVVVLAGGEDREAPPDEVRATFEQVRSHGKFIVFEGVAHAQIYQRSPDRYHETLLELIAAAENGPNE